MAHHFPGDHTLTHQRGKKKTIHTHFEWIQQVISSCFLRFPLVSVSCPDPEQQNGFLTNSGSFFSQPHCVCTRGGVLKARSRHVRVTTCILLLRKVPPCDRSASCRRSLMAERTVAPPGSCCTAEWEKTYFFQTFYNSKSHIWHGQWWTVRWAVPYIADVARWWPVVWPSFCQHSLFTRKQVIPLFLPEALVYRHDMALCGEDVLVIRFVKWVVLIEQLQCKRQSFVYMTAWREGI